LTAAAIGSSATKDVPAAVKQCRAAMPPQHGLTAAETPFEPHRCV
jgi:hypothetical protein